MKGFEESKKMVLLTLAVALVCGILGKIIHGKGVIQ